MSSSKQDSQGKEPVASELPSLPGIGSVVSASAGDVGSNTATELKPVEQASRRTVENLKLEVFIVDVPFITEGTDGYQDDERNRRCDVGILSREHARKLRAIRRGYDQSSGKDVKSLADAVRAWLDSIDI